MLTSIYSVVLAALNTNCFFFYHPVTKQAMKVKKKKKL